MSDTPETDRRIIRQSPRMCGCGYKKEIVFADFARRLERERNALYKLLAISDKQLDAVIVERDASIRERDAAIADLNILCDKVLELNILLQEHGIIEYGN